MWKYMPCVNVVGRSRRSPARPSEWRRQARVRARPSPDPFDPFVDYVSARLVDDPHLWARTLFDELEGLGFELSYPSLTRNIRARNLRPMCEVCRTATHRPECGHRAPTGR
jgi:hypothetical protein